MTDKERIEGAKALYNKLVRKQSQFGHRSKEYDLFDFMILGLGHALNQGKYPSEKVLYIQAVREISYRPANSIIASQVLPDSVKREIFYMCEYEGYSFINGRIISPEMKAKVGETNSEHAGLMPGVAVKTRKPKHDTRYNLNIKGYKLNNITEYSRPVSGIESDSIERKIDKSEKPISSINNNGYKLDISYDDPHNLLHQIRSMGK